MGDPNGPWQDYGHGHDDRPGGGVPRHLAPPWGVAEDRYHWDAPPTHPCGIADLYAAADAYGDDSYGDDGYGDAYDDDAEARWPLQWLVAEAAWRYRSAPLWARITADIAAASLVLALIVGVSLALRHEGEPPVAAADRSATTGPPGTALAPTTSSTTTTTEPPTTTTEPTTTTTAPPTTTQPMYRDCRDAFRAGALPLFAGDPGYGPHLDRDGDGEACEWDDRRG